MSTGAVARPTVPRNSATSARSCAGFSQLRLNRMKPRGSASRKKARSWAESAGPAQPTISARGSRLDNDAPDAAAFQFAAIALFCRRIPDRPGLDAIEGAARAEIDAVRAQGERAQYVAIAVL